MPSSTDPRLTLSDPPPPYHSLISTIHIPSAAGAPSRRSEPDRQSLSDLSLHTIQRTTLSPAQQKRIQELVGSGAHTGEGLPRRASEVEDDAKYWTARGTLKSVVPGLADEEGQESTGEGARDGPMEEREVLVLVHEPNSTTGPDGLPGQTPSEAGTLPSRFLYIFHPPDPPSPTASAAGSSLPFGLKWDEVDPWKWIETAKNEFEKAFWGILMPGMKGLVEMGEAVASIPALLSSDSEHALELRSDGRPADMVFGSQNPPGRQRQLDLGPTLPPVTVEKCSSMPSWEDRRDIDHRGWARDPMDMGVRN
ncbi:hypothetical protein IAR50_004711 [Cryptococcus sp. DSM 104548]